MDNNVGLGQAMFESHTRDTAKKMQDDVATLRADTTKLVETISTEIVIVLMRFSERIEALEAQIKDLRQ